MSDKDKDIPEGPPCPGCHGPHGITNHMRFS